MQRIARHSLVALFALLGAFTLSASVAAQTPINVTGFKTSATPTPTPFFVNDTFTGTDGTLLSAHTGETGAAWSLHPSFTDTFVITSNRASKDANTATSVYTASGVASSINYTVQCPIVDIGNVNRAAGCGGWVKTAADDGIYVRRLNSTTWQFVKIIAGTPTAVPMTTGSNTVTATFSVGVTTTLKVVRTAGDNFEWFIDNVSQGTATISDSNFQAASLPNGVGWVAVRSSNNHSGTGYHIDRISAW